MSELTLNDAKRMLLYCPDTGDFKRLVAVSNQPVGSIAGSVNTIGYVQIRLLGKNYLAHRLAIFLTTGQWPEGQVDHINRDRSDNRLANLRVLSAAENKQNCLQRSNSKSGIKGVHYCSRTKKWVAQICHGNQRKFLGRFLDVEAAAEAYAYAAAAVHKFNPVGFMPNGVFVKDTA